MKKRILILLRVVALMIVMLAMSVSAAFPAGGPEKSCLAYDRSQYNAPMCPALNHT
jgi:hypothetical protein